VKVLLSVFKYIFADTWKNLSAFIFTARQFYEDWGLASAATPL
jgi:hypothetical protein